MGYSKQRREWRFFLLRPGDGRWLVRMVQIGAGWKAFSLFLEGLVLGACMVIAIRGIGSLAVRRGMGAFRAFRPGGEGREGKGIWGLQSMVRFGCLIGYGGLVLGLIWLGVYFSEWEDMELYMSMDPYRGKGNKSIPCAITAIDYISIQLIFNGLLCTEASKQQANK
ncbi:hypothetical protein EYC80_002489 [Monilinia laxa]|uniref:Uncharacterized protein n=1 Tax=Monilinia laxa TaxID=61186 RepID=A0A5N6K4Q8_MONLA|nr:hypothetical protein EYC80_002489 [Monilinia laxa]